MVTDKIHCFPWGSDLVRRGRHDGHLPRRPPRAPRLHASRCPCRALLDLLADKWPALVTGALEDGPRRLRNPGSGSRASAPRCSPGPSAAASTAAHSTAPSTPPPRASNTPSPSAAAPPSRSTPRAPGPRTTSARPSRPDPSPGDPAATPTARTTGNAPRGESRRRVHACPRHPLVPAQPPCRRLRRGDTSGVPERTITSAVHARPKRTRAATATNGVTTALPHRVSPTPKSSAK